MSITKSRNDLTINTINGTIIEEVLTNDLNRNSGTLLTSATLSQNQLSTSKLDINSYATSNNRLGKLGTQIDKVNSVKKVILMGKMSTTLESDALNVFYSRDDATYIMGHATRGSLNPIDSKRHFILELEDFSRYIKVGNINAGNITNIDIDYIFLK